MYRQSGGMGYGDTFADAIKGPHAGAPGAKDHACRQEPRRAILRVPSQRALREERLNLPVLKGLRGNAQGSLLGTPPLTCTAS